MKKGFKKLFSGINGKIMKILIVLSIFMIVIFVGVTITLLHMLHVTIDEVQQKEYEVVENNSKDAVMNITKDSFLKTVTWASDQIDDEFLIIPVIIAPNNWKNPRRKMVENLLFNYCIPRITIRTIRVSERGSEKLPISPL